MKRNGLNNTKKFFVKAVAEDTTFILHWGIYTIAD